VIFDGVERAAARGIDLVLADTAGRLHTKTNLMEELRKVRRVAEKEPGGSPRCCSSSTPPPARTGSQAREFTEATEVTGVVLTKLDGSAKGGIVFAIETELGIPVKLVGLGETIGDLVEFDPTSSSASTGYQFVGGADADEAEVARLASALGVEGDPVRGGGATADGVLWRVGPDDGSAASLTVIADAQLGWYYSSAWAETSRSDLAEPCRVTTDDQGNVIEEICPEPVPPTGVPTADEAEAAARALLTATGEDLEAFEFEAYADQWYASVTAWLVLDGIRSPMAWSFGYGGDGVLQWAGGYLAEPVATGPYPLIDLDTAIVRLEDQSGMWGGVMRAEAGAADGAAVLDLPAEPAVDDSVVPEPVPVESVPSRACPSRACRPRRCRSRRCQSRRCLSRPCRPRRCQSRRCQSRRCQSRRCQSRRCARDAAGRGRADRRGARRRARRPVVGVGRRRVGLGMFDTVRPVRRDLQALRGKGRLTRGGRRRGPAGDPPRPPRGRRQLHRRQGHLVGRIRERASAPSCPRRSTRPAGHQDRPRGAHAILGGETLKITYASKPPTVVLMAGLQGSGKTTNSAKLARWFKQQGRNPLLVGADLQRPAAVEQLRTLGRQIDVPVFSEPGDPVPSTVARRASRRPAPRPRRRHRRHRRPPRHRRRADGAGPPDLRGDRPTTRSSSSTP
jgi:hypothetical protein